jgi:hypothetical protein
LKLTIKIVVDAIRDQQFMKQMDELPRMFESSQEQRLFLQRTFPDTMGNLEAETAFLKLPESPIRKVDTAGVVRELLVKILPFKVAFSRQRFGRYYEESPYLRRLSDWLFMSLLAIRCGSSLVVPMVIMVLNPSVNKSLITTSIAVAIFGFTLGFVDRTNIMSLTSAYAAVLVGFVGTSGTAS